MDVIKKSGRKEEFSIEKLSNSINSANYSTSEKINTDMLLAEFRQIINEKNLITTGQIDVIVSGLLYTNNHFETLARYMSYDKEAKTPFE